jgi:hypothetical protein
MFKQVKRGTADTQFLQCIMYSRQPPERLLDPQNRYFTIGVSLTLHFWEIYGQAFESTVKNDQFLAESTVKLFLGVATLLSAPKSLFCMQLLAKIRNDRGLTHE